MQKEESEILKKTRVFDKKLSIEELTEKNNTTSPREKSDHFKKNSSRTPAMSTAPALPAVSPFSELDKASAMNAFILLSNGSVDLMFVDNHAYVRIEL